MDLSARLGLIVSVPFYQAAFWGHAADLLDAFFWPFLLGPTLGALALAAVTYAVALRVLTRRAAAGWRSRPPASVLAGDAEQRAADRHVNDAQGAGLDA